MAGSTQPENSLEQVSLRVVAFTVTDELRARLRGVLPENADVRLCRTLRQLSSTALSSQPSVIVLELVDGQGERLAPSVRWLRSAFPSVPIVACCALSGATAHDILTLAKAGVTDLALRGFDDIASTISTAIRGTSLEGVAAQVVRELGPVLPRRMRPIVEYCIANARAGLTVDEIAAALGMPRKTLARQLAQAGLPSPKRLIAWGRVFMAARLMEDHARSIERIALDLDFPTPSAFRKLLRRLTGLRPLDVRASGGLDCVQSAFRREVRDGRKNAREVAA
ncbi:MAG TPA: AraC family transcriptional regulator [Gemmatimonadaceae bacterium]|nr:AraC family transcriptional regulator [Gemmatimonadaceae bacterium]